MIDRTISNDEPSTGSPAPLANGAHLFRVIVGQKPLLGGARHALAGVREIQIGRTPETFAARADGVLTIGVADPRMSGKHARVANEGGVWTITDLGSTNGTFVDGGRLTAAPLHDGAVLEIGSTIFIFRADLAFDPSTSPDREASTLPGRSIGLASLVPSQEKAVESLREVAAAGVPVLLLGPSGAGKEVTAR